MVKEGIMVVTPNYRFLLILKFVSIHLFILYNGGCPLRDDKMSTESADS